MSRKNDSQADEVSSVRRSSRLTPTITDTVLKSETETTTTSARITRARRASNDSDAASTDVKPATTRTRRNSQDIVTNGKIDTKVAAATRTRRPSLDSNSEKEVKAAPVARTRRASALLEEEQKKMSSENKQDTSKAEEEKNQPKKRGRRSSITKEATAESSPVRTRRRSLSVDDAATLEHVPTPRPNTRTRRSSISSKTEEEPQKKPATRSRRGSTDDDTITGPENEEEPQAKTAKLAKPKRRLSITENNLEPIVESEAEVKSELIVSKSKKDELPAEDIPNAGIKKKNESTLINDPNLSIIAETSLLEEDSSPRRSPRLKRESSISRLSTGSPKRSLEKSLIAVSSEVEQTKTVLSENDSTEPEKEDEKLTSPTKEVRKSLNKDKFGKILDEEKPDEKLENDVLKISPSPAKEPTSMKNDKKRLQLSTRKSLEKTEGNKIDEESNRKSFGTNESNEKSNDAVKESPVSSKLKLTSETATKSLEKKETEQISLEEQYVSLGSDGSFHLKRDVSVCCSSDNISQEELNESKTNSGSDKENSSPLKVLSKIGSESESLLSETNAVDVFKPDGKELSFCEPMDVDITLNETKVSTPKITRKSLESKTTSADSKHVAVKSKENTSGDEKSLFVKLQDCKLLLEKTHSNDDINLELTEGDTKKSEAANSVKNASKEAEPEIAKVSESNDECVELSSEETHSNADFNLELQLSADEASNDSKTENKSRGNNEGSSNPDKKATDIHTETEVANSTEENSKNIESGSKHDSIISEIAENKVTTSDQFIEDEETSKKSVSYQSTDIKSRSSDDEKPMSESEKESNESGNSFRNERVGAWLNDIKRVEGEIGESSSFSESIVSRTSDKVKKKSSKINSSKRDSFVEPSDKGRTDQNEITEKIGNIEKTPVPISTSSNIVKDPEDNDKEISSNVVDSIDVSDDENDTAKEISSNIVESIDVSDGENDTAKGVSSDVIESIDVSDSEYETTKETSSISLQKEDNKKTSTDAILNEAKSPSKIVNEPKSDDKSSTQMNDKVTESQNLQENNVTESLNPVKDTSMVSKEKQLEENEKVKVTQDDKELTEAPKSPNKNRKLLKLEEYAQNKLDEFISKRGGLSSDDDDSVFEESSCSEDFEGGSGFVDEMAEEGEEDTPSEGSNDIVDFGESIKSTDSERDSDDDDYENDSFVCDDGEEVEQLLSGNEYDIDFGKDVEKDQKNTNSNNNKNVAKHLSPKRVNKESSSESDSNDMNKFEEFLKSRRTEEDYLNIDASSTDQKSPKVRPSSTRKSSITILENIRVDDIKDATLSQRINELVETFCSNVNKGEISMNLSLEYADNSNENSANKKNTSEIDPTKEHLNKSLDIKVNKLKRKSDESIEVIPEKIIKLDTSSKKSKTKKLKKKSNEFDVNSSVIEEIPSRKRKHNESFDITENQFGISNEDLPNIGKSRSNARLSKSLEILPKKRTKKNKKRKMENMNEKKSDLNKIRPSKSMTDLRESTFNIMNQLVNEERKTRTPRLIKPSREMNDSSWMVENIKIKPSTSAVSKKEKKQFELTKMQSNDFKNQMLYSSNRVKRMESKEMLRKKGAYF